MRDLKYYEDKNKQLLETDILEKLKDGPVQISVDCKIETKEDIDNKYIQFSIRRKWRAAGRVEYEKAKIPEMRFMKFEENMKLNGIPLDNGIVIPFLAPNTVEDDEIGLNMICEGLILSVQKEYDEYYHKLLLSFDLSHLPADIQGEVKRWGSEI